MWARHNDSWLVYDRCDWDQHQDCKLFHSETQFARNIKSELLCFHFSSACKTVLWSDYVWQWPTAEFQTSPDKLKMPHSFYCWVWMLNAQAVFCTIAMVSWIICEWIWNICRLNFVLQTLFSVPWPLCSIALLAHRLQQHPTEGLHHRVRLAHLNLQIMSIAAVGCRQTQEGGSLWLGKSNKHVGLHPMLALRQSHIMAIQSHSFFLTTCFSGQQMS